jgi:hypothetical protein
MRKLNIAILSEQVTIPSSPEQVHVTSGSIIDYDAADELGDLSIAMTDLKYIDDVIGQAVDAAQELIEEEQAVEQVSQDGASQAALESLQRNVNCLLKQVGFEQGATFAIGAYSNKKHNKIALESAKAEIKSFLIRIWEAIKAAINKTMEMVDAIFKNIFDLSRRIKKSSERVKEIASSKKGKVHLSETKVGSHTLAKYARFNNKPLLPGDLVNNFDTWTAHNYNFIESLAGKESLQEYKKFIEMAAVLFNKLGVSPEDAQPLKKETDSMGDLFLKRLIDNFDYHKEGIHTTKPFIGDVHYKFSEVDLSFEIEKEDKYVTIKSEGTHLPFTAEQVIEMCEKLSSHMDTYNSINKHFDGLDKIKNSINKIANEVIAEKNDSSLVNRKLISSSVSFVVKLFIDAIRKVGVGAREYDLHMCNAILQWCGLSINSL